MSRAKVQVRGQVEGVERTKKRREIGPEWMDFYRFPGGVDRVSSAEAIRVRQGVEFGLPLGTATFASSQVVGAQSELCFGSIGRQSTDLIVSEGTVRPNTERSYDTFE